MFASPGQYSECTGFFRFPGQYQSVKSVESPIQQTKEEILSSIPKHPTAQSFPKQTKTNEKEEKAAALHAAILTNQPQVSRPRSQLTIPGSIQEITHTKCAATAFTSTQPAATQPSPPNP
jgi:hypothetical protein